jgi:hypothetical protein
MIVPAGLPQYDPGVRRARGRYVLAGAIAVMAAGAFVLPGPARGRDLATPTLPFTVFIKTTQFLDSLVWTGKQFLYVQNTANTVWAAPPAGQPLQQFATMPRLVEETRCILSPGTRGFPPGAIFCHSPDNKIYEISPDGARVTVFATLPTPYPPRSDGALAFDRVGHFGYKLVAATGYNGSAGGRVFTVGSGGVVRQVGKYPGPGGADELMIAPGRFGSLGGDALLTIDAGASKGSVVAVTPSGQTRTVVTFPSGVNPIALIPKLISGRTGEPSPGLYVSDDTTGYTYRTPAASLARYAGDVIVGTESPRPLFSILEPRGTGLAKIPLGNNLPAGRFSLEQAIFIP